MSEVSNEVIHSDSDSQSYNQGDIVLVELPAMLVDQSGGRHKKQIGKKTRPCLILFNSRKKSKHSIILVAPLTSQINESVTENPELYPILAKEIISTTENSVVLLDKIQSIDSSQIKKKISSLHYIYLKMILDQLKSMFDTGSGGHFEYPDYESEYLDNDIQIRNPFR